MYHLNPLFNSFVTLELRLCQIVARIGTLPREHASEENVLRMLSNAS